MSLVVWYVEQCVCLEYFDNLLTPLFASGSLRTILNFGNLTFFNIRVVFELDQHFANEICCKKWVLYKSPQTWSCKTYRKSSLQWPIIVSELKYLSHFILSSSSFSIAYFTLFWFIFFLSSFKFLIAEITIIVQEDRRLLRITGKIRSCCNYLAERTIHRFPDLTF